MNGTGLVGILHPVVITGDFDSTLSFYRDLLGFVPQPVTTHDPQKLTALGGPADADAKAVILNAPDGSELEIASFRFPKGRARSDRGWTDAGIRSITFVVRDIVAMTSRLDAAGYPVVNEIVDFTVESEAVRVCYVEGPDGVVLTLLQRGS